MHQLGSLSNVKPFVFFSFATSFVVEVAFLMPFSFAFPLPFPLPSRGGGSCFGSFGLGCSSDEMSDLTTVISLRHSSKAQVPLENNWEIAFHIYRRRRILGP